MVPPSESRDRGKHTWWKLLLEEYAPDDLSQGSTSNSVKAAPPMPNLPQEPSKQASYYFDELIDSKTIPRNEMMINQIKANVVSVTEYDRPDGG